MGILYVDGKKVLGGGKIHSITTLGTGYSFAPGGYFHWNVVNGLCFVTVWGVIVASTFDEIMATGLPKSKMTCGAQGNTSGSTGSYLIFVTQGGTVLRYNKWGTVGHTYSTLTYPIDDDYAEPAAYL